MTRICPAIATVMTMFCAPALAQPAVFFDDFDGDALLPHWNQPAPSDWEYNVSNSMLNVTDLFYPSSPKSPGNITSISAAFTAQADFRMDAWMGWEAGQQPHRLAVYVGGPFGGNPIIASFGYRNEAAFGPSPLVFAGASNQSLFMPAPLPGIHHFAVSRTGSQFNFYLNEIPFASFIDQFGTPAAAVWVEFVGPYPGTLGPLHVDRIQVVPVPGMVVVLLTFALGHNRRRIE